MKKQYLVILGFILLISFYFFAPKNWQDFLQKSTQTTTETNKKLVITTVGIFPDDCDWQVVERVIDGDTIKIKNKEKVRYIGINTPEVKGPYTKEQPFGPEASEKMKEFLHENDKVCLITDLIGNKYDKYDRRLAYVYDEVGKNLNAEMVKLGLAKVYRKFKFDHKQKFLEYEQVARSHALGVWSW